MNWLTETSQSWLPVLALLTVASGVIGFAWRKVILPTHRRIKTMAQQIDEALNPEKNCIVKQLDARLETVELAVAESLELGHKALEQIRVLGQGQMEAARLASVAKAELEQKP